MPVRRGRGKLRERKRRNSDIRRGCSLKSLTIRRVECRGQEKNMDGGVRFSSTRAERTRDWSYPLMIGMEGATKG